MKAILTATKCDSGGYVPYDYCDPKLKLCPTPGSHTMCLYPVPGLSKDCAPFINEPLSPDEKLQLLSLHNKLRSRIATGEEKTPLGVLPSASNMLQMRWDDELETIAERWASRCLNVTVTKLHDDCRHTKRFRVTQNIGTIGSKGTTADKQVVKVFYHWYIKNKSFNPGTINAYVADDNKTSEEFVNLIWAETYALGCARVIFRNNLTDSKDGDGAAPWTFERVVCNYGPGGIIPGKPVYKAGAPCSQCATGWKCSQEYSGLCVLKAIVKSSTRNTTITVSPSTKPIKPKPVKPNKTSITGASSAFRYSNTSPTTSEPHKTVTGFQEWSVSPVETGNYNFKLRTGIYYNGVCHCPDVTRYGFEEGKKHQTNLTAKLEKLKSLIIRSIGDGLSQTETENVMSGLKNGDVCYCKISASKAGDQCKQSAFVLGLTMFVMMEFVI